MREQLLVTVSVAMLDIPKRRHDLMHDSFDAGHFHRNLKCYVCKSGSCDRSNQMNVKPSIKASQHLNHMASPDVGARTGRV